MAYVDMVWQMCRLVGSGIRYRAVRLSGRPHRLESLSLEITHRCICRCSMCNIWKIPSQVPDLDLSVWLELLSSPELSRLREIDLTGGEPFLREEIGAFLHGICDLHPSRFPQLRTVAITTNGILTGKVLGCTSEIIGRLRKLGVDLVLACGMDAVGEIHDRIRGFPGAWEKLQSTLSGLREIRQVHPNLILGIKTTIVPLNVPELGRIAEFARAEQLFTIISPRIITPNRFGNRDLEDELAFSPDDLAAIRQFYESSRGEWSAHRETMLGYLRTGKVHKPCSAGFNTLFVRHNGDVFPCPVLPVALGNIRERSLGELVGSLPAAQFRKQVGSFPDCSVCTEPGMERLAWSCEGFQFLRLLTRLGTDEFTRLAHHMGLDKYH